MLLIDLVGRGFMDGSLKVAAFSVKLRVKLRVFGIGVIDYLKRLKLSFFLVLSCHSYGS